MEINRLQEQLHQTIRSLPQYIDGNPDGTYSCKAGMAPVVRDVLREIENFLNTGATLDPLTAWNLEPAATAINADVNRIACRILNKHCADLPLKCIDGQTVNMSSVVFFAKSPIFDESMKEGFMVPEINPLSVQVTSLGLRTLLGFWETGTLQVLVEQGKLTPEGMRDALSAADFLSCDIVEEARGLLPLLLETLGKQLKVTAKGDRASVTTDLHNSDELAQIQKLASCTGCLGYPLKCKITFSDSEKFPHLIDIITRQADFPFQKLSLNFRPKPRQRELDALKEAFRVNQVLQGVSLEGLPFSHRSETAFINFLRKQGRIKHIKLRNVQDMHWEMYYIMKKWIKHNGLKSLGLVNCVGEWDEVQIEQLCQCIENHGSLKNLNLADNVELTRKCPKTLGIRAPKAIKKMLTQNYTLEKLSLRNCGMISEETSPILSGVRSNGSLKKADLRGNGLRGQNLGWYRREGLTLLPAEPTNEREETLQDGDPVRNALRLLQHW